MRALIPAIAAVALLAGCETTQPLYFWGSYEPLTYGAYAKPGKVSSEEQIGYLEADIQKAAARNAALPPGFHAYLGYLYYRTGNGVKARQEFETEKQLFPESAVFVDQLLKGLPKN